MITSHPSAQAPNDPTCHLSDDNRLDHGPVLADLLKKMQLMRDDRPDHRMRLLQLIETTGQFKYSPQRFQEIRVRRSHHLQRLRHPGDVITQNLYQFIHRDLRMLLRDLNEPRHELRIGLAVRGQRGQYTPNLFNLWRD